MSHGESYVVGIIVGLCWGFAGNTLLTDTPAYNKPTEFKAEERQNNALVFTKPVEIKLKIVPWDEFVKGHPNVAAYAQPYSAPCKIFIPEGWAIQVDFLNQNAKWLIQDNGDTLAHEILHCLRGRWHSQ